MRKRLFIGAVLASMMLVACNGENKPDISNMEKHTVAETTTETEAETTTTEPETTSVETLNPEAHRDFNPYFRKDSPAEMAEEMRENLMDVCLLQMNAVTLEYFSKENRWRKSGNT